MKITVKIYQKDEEILSKVLGEGAHRIGRSEFSDIVLPSDKISRSHVELRVSAASAYMTNMAAAGKVKINGKAKETCELADGDELKVGPYRIVVFHGERDVPPSAEQAAADLAPADGAAAAPDDAIGGDAGFGGDGAFGAGGFGAPAPAEGFGGFGSPADSAEPQAELLDLQPERKPSDRPVESSVARVDTQQSLRPLVAKLLFVEGPRKGEEMFLEAYEVGFGRSRRADIFIDDPNLSRLHAKITRVGMGYRLIDLNSRHGTYVNGIRILEHPLNSFDVIEFGKSKIKFLIHDMLVSEGQRGGAMASAPGTHGNLALDQTKSVALAEIAPDLTPHLQLAPEPAFDSPQGFAARVAPYYQDPKKRKMLLMGLIVALGLVFLMSPSGDDKKATKTAEVAKTEVEDKDTKAPPMMPREYAELSPEVQRTIEGHYNSAQAAAESRNYREALNHIKSIHEYLPFYKQSREMQDIFARKAAEQKQIEDQERLKRDEKATLAIHLRDGIEYLKDGDFPRAAEEFNAAIVMQPNNEIAIRGLKAAEAQVRDMNQLPPERDPEGEKKQLVAELFQKAVAAFGTKSYQEAIDTAEKIRQIEIRGETQYLNEAKQIIDRARIQQKEEFEPFLIQAKEKYAEGDYNSSRDLCEEMLKRDPSYDDAKECVLKAKKQLNRLAKEAYTHGYILESMNRIEEAKQYWNRARNYVRAGDDYFDKVMKKLDYYQ